MVGVTLVGKAVAYGTPPLLILLGFSAYSSGKFAELIFGTSEGITLVGGTLMALGIGMGVVELLLKFR